MFQTMERRLLRAIMNPAMIATWVFGLLVAFTPGIVDWSAGWPWVKVPVSKTAGETMPVYRFDHQVRDDDHVHLSPKALCVDGYAQPIHLDIENPFEVLL